MPIDAIDHVQLAMPAGREEEARAFYDRLLGIPEVPKPPDLRKRGGAWFEKGEVRIHLGVDPEFRPARKAHPGLRVRELEALVSKLRHAGCAVSEYDLLSGARRVFISDPFGNRLELIELE
jgi:catechol 2,3-dioxygenase-like lactoylglutathione lyase family enzyme